MISEADVTRLNLPSRRRVVLDTDTYNEVDDQFALVHLMLSLDQIDVEAIYAAPFYVPNNLRSANPAEGMERSYEEILRILKLIDRYPGGGPLRGSARFMADPSTPVESAAALDLVERATKAEDRSLYVCAIGAITNIASALLLEPAIAERIVIIWLGGHAPYWPDTAEFNLRQDLHAVRVVLDASVPLVLIPCFPVASHLKTTVAELEAHLAPFSALGRYLTDIVRDHGNNALGWSKVIWDLSASAYVLNERWVPTYEAPAPALLDDLTWGHDPTRRKIRIAQSVNRDAIFRDFFLKTRQLAK